MVLATLICSDEACAEELNAVVDDLDALERLACDCGCTFQVLAIDEWEAAAPAVAVVLAVAA